MTKTGIKSEISTKKITMYWVTIVVIVITVATRTTCISGKSLIKAPVIKHKGVEAKYQEGEKLELKCQGVKPLTWNHSKLIFTANSRAKMISLNEIANQGYSSTLIIQKLTVEDSGVIFCKYTSPELSSYVDSIYITVTKDRKGMSTAAKAVLGILIVVCIGTFIMLIVYRQFKQRNKSEPKKAGDPEVPDETESCLPGERPANENEFYRGAVECIDPDLNMSDQADLLPFESHWEFPRDRLQLGAQLGFGAFGKVLKAEAIGLLESEPSTTVAVKMLKPNADENHMKALICELKIMAHLGRHINVVNLHGACTRNLSKNNELFVIVEYCRHGSLLNYIRRHNKSFINQIVWDGANNEIVDPTITESIETTAEAGAYYDSGSSASGGGLHSGATDDSFKRNTQSLNRFESKREPGGQSIITTTDLLCWAFQIARGMEYLASRKVIHGDLATRNALLTDNYVVKICDFGLAKEMYKDYNYIMSTKGGNFPVKWMAIESIYYGELSTMSDCWSFGVVLWELFSLGKIPYPGIKADEELIKRIDEGYRMEKPEYAPSSIYKIMQECWAHDKGERPSFPRLVERIGNLVDAKLRDHIIELNAEFVRRYQTTVPAAFPNSSQAFPELDSYGYLKPIEVAKPTKEERTQTQASSTVVTAQASRLAPNNNYVPDPTSSKHSTIERSQNNDDSTC